MSDCFGPWEQRSVGVVWFSGIMSILTKVQFCLLCDSQYSETSDGKNIKFYYDKLADWENGRIIMLMTIFKGFMCVCVEGF